MQGHLRIRGAQDVLFGCFWSLCLYKNSLKISMAATPCLPCLTLCSGGKCSPDSSGDPTARPSSWDQALAVGSQDNPVLMRCSTPVPALPPPGVWPPQPGGRRSESTPKWEKQEPEAPPRWHGQPQPIRLTKENCMHFKQTAPQWGPPEAPGPEQKPFLLGFEGLPGHRHS